MHISAEELCSDRLTPERDKSMKMKLNIPIKEKTEGWREGKEDFYEEPQRGLPTLRGGSRAMLLRSKFDVDAEKENETLLSLSRLRLGEPPPQRLNITLTNTSTNDSFHLRRRSASPSSEESESSSDEESRKELESTLIAKCPDKLRDAKKEQQRTLNRPYQVPRQAPCLQSSGGLVSFQNNFKEPLTFPQIPQPVEDFARDETWTLTDWLGKLSDEERRVLDSTLDSLRGQTGDGGESVGNPAPATGHSLPSHSQQASNTGVKHQQGATVVSGAAPSRLSRPDDSCNSPDSSYGTMSPVSVPPSPYTLHSPNPRFEQKRNNSESDSTGESELNVTELPFQKIPQIPQMANFIYAPPRAQPTSQPPVYTPPLLVMPFGSLPLRPDSTVVVNEVGLERPAVDRLKERKLLNASLVEIEWAIALYEAKPLLPDGRLSPSNVEAKKTDLRLKLVELLETGPRSRHFWEKLYCKVKLYKKKELEEILSGKELTETTPLLVAALQRAETPLVARLLADSLNPPETYDSGGNSLLHYLAERGDSHAQVLAELLHVRALFAVNHKNAGSRTPLHVAVQTHPRLASLAVVKLFVRHGALLKIQDLYGRTVLHLAVSAPQSDPHLLRALLMSSWALEAVNMVDNDMNTPLHIAASRNDLPLDKHKELVSQLINSKASHCLRNKNEKVALALVNENRKLVENLECVKYLGVRKSK